MQKSLIELREGYFFLLLKISRRSEALERVDFGFKYLFFGYYLSIICLIIVLLTYNNHPLRIPKTILNQLIIGFSILYVYHRLSIYLFKGVNSQNIDEDQPKNMIKTKMIKSLCVFLGSFVSLGVPIVLLLGLTGKL